MTAAGARQPEPDPVDTLVAALFSGLVRHAEVNAAIYKPWVCKRCGRINPSTALVCSCPGHAATEA